MNLLIVTGIFPPDVGGPATYVPRIAGHLHDANWNVEVVTAGETETETSFPYPVHRVPRKAPFRYVQSLPVLKNRAGWADVVYVNGLEFDSFLAGYLHDKPVVQKCVGDRSWERYRNVHGGELGIEDFQESFPGWLPYLERTLHRRISRSSDSYVVPSRFLKTILTKWGIDPSDITVIYNHSHPPESIPESSVSWPGSGRKLLTVGRLVPWKRVPQIIEFLEPLPDWGLIVLGDGPDYEKCLETSRSLDLESRISLKGNVERKVVWQHLREADVLLLNSTYEGFPHILLESMASGTPAVVSNAEGSSELAGFFSEHIHLYDKNRASELVELLKNRHLESFEPPEFPDPLKWETIAGRTGDLLKTRAESR